MYPMLKRWVLLPRDVMHIRNLWFLHNGVWVSSNVENLIILHQAPIWVNFRQKPLPVTKPRYWLKGTQITKFHTKTNERVRSFLYQVYTVEFQLSQIYRLSCTPRLYFFYFLHAASCRENLSGLFKICCLIGRIYWVFLFFNVRFFSRLLVLSWWEFSLQITTRKMRCLRELLLSTVISVKRF